MSGRHSKAGRMARKLYDAKRRQFWLHCEWKLFRKHKVGYLEGRCILGDWFEECVWFSQVDLMSEEGIKH